MKILVQTLKPGERPSTRFAGLLNFMNIPTLEGEIWKEIPTLNGHYYASNLGRIYSVARRYPFTLRNGEIIYRQSPGRILNQFTEKAGYKRVQICGVKGKAKEKVHRLVCMAFHGLPNGKMDVNHKNKDKTDNRPENLEWISHRENVLHGQAGRSSTGFVGIYFHPKRNRFQGSILVGKKRHGIGDHKTLQEAVNAYKNKVESLGLSGVRYLLGLDARC